MQSPWVMVFRGSVVNLAALLYRAILGGANQILFLRPIALNMDNKTLNRLSK